jgi:hypothetical protein
LMKRERVSAASGGGRRIGDDPPYLEGN